MKKSSTRCPKHLSVDSKRIWREIVAEYQIEDCAGLRILRVALESYDRAQACRKQIDREGLTVRDKFNQVKSHPLLSAERDSRQGFLAGIKALSLDLEPIKNIGRPAGS